MHPVILDLGFWFCDNAHDAPCQLICQALFDEEYPFRFLVILFTFVFLAMTQVIFYACCVVGPFVICKCFSNPPENWLTSTNDDDDDDNVWGSDRRHSSLSLAETKLKMKEGGTLDHLLYRDDDDDDHGDPHGQELTSRQRQLRRIHQDVCPICLSSYQRDDELVVSKSCQHSFHEDCLARWLSRQPICPCCRVQILHKNPRPTT